MSRKKREVTTGGVQRRSTFHSWVLIGGDYFVRISGGLGQATWMVDPTYISATGIIRSESIVRENEALRAEFVGFPKLGVPRTPVSLRISNNRNVFCASLNRVKK